MREICCPESATFGKAFFGGYALDSYFGRDIEFFVQFSVFHNVLFYNVLYVIYSIFNPYGRSLDSARDDT